MPKFSLKRFPRNPFFIQHSKSCISFSTKILKSRDYLILYEMYSNVLDNVKNIFEGVGGEIKGLKSDFFLIYKSKFKKGLALSCLLLYIIHTIHICIMITSTYTIQSIFNNKISILEICVQTFSSFNKVIYFSITIQI